MKEIASSIFYGAIVISSSDFIAGIIQLHPNAKVINPDLFYGQIEMRPNETYIIDDRFADRVFMGAFGDTTFCPFNDKRGESGLILKYLKELVEEINSMEIGIEIIKE